MTSHIPHGKSIAAVVIIYLACIGGLMAQSKFSNATNAEVASWKPFLTYADSELNLPAPPDEKSSRKEVTEIKSKMANVDEHMMQRIKYWDAGAPSYRWNDMASRLVTFHDINTFMRFPTAWVNMAIYDATLAAWKEKAKHKRLRNSIKLTVLSPI